jgi:hypothetical protein
VVIKNIGLIFFSTGEFIIVRNLTNLLIIVIDVKPLHPQQRDNLATRRPAQQHLSAQKIT